MIVHGTVAAGFEGVRDAFELGHADVPGGAQLCVYRGDSVVVDLWGGTDVHGTVVEADSLTGLASATKGEIAMTALMLIDEGVLDASRPLSYYWPEYAANGKGDTLLEHALTHTTGTPVPPSDSGIESVELADWDRCIHAFERAEPLWKPGTRWSYHAVAIGFLVGEVIRRATGRPAGELFRERISGPLGADSWIGLPPEYDDRVLIRTPWPDLAESADATAPEPTGDRAVDEVSAGSYALRGVIEFLNTPEGRRAEIGGGNGVASARGLAREYAAAIGEVDGIRLFSEEALAYAMRDRTGALPTVWPTALEDLVAGARSCYGLGFAVENAAWSPPWPTGWFGHGGAGGIQGFAHPASGLAVGYTCTDLHPGPVDPRQGWLPALFGDRSA